MPYVITEACTDVMDRSCMTQCPVDCIYQGARALYINPDECIECGACEAACPVGAVYLETDLPDEFASSAESNRDFFVLTLPGRDEPLGSPGGAMNIGPIGIDTSHVAALPTR
ncbi:NAD-dependent dihydropyrimidine dehydrogenase PreA subunit [Rhodococcus sp. 27YEA15]|uniref:ferredoxin n=1 Tax=Rhodococcus sp. 27YEA15 TaxID=3156259 RepID=UPI003C7A8593